MRLVYGSPFPEGDRERQQWRAQAMGMAFVDLDRIRPDPETVSLIPADLARELRALPVKRDGQTLWVGLDGPGLDSLKKIKDATGLRVIPVLCAPDALDDALRQLLS